MKNTLEGKNAVIIARASTTKQFDAGDTLDHQINQCEIYIKKMGMHLIKAFTLVESGRNEEREFFTGILNYCLNPKNRVQAVVFKDISRFTRQGSNTYTNLKQQLSRANIRLVDTMGIIQEEENILAHLNVVFDWSLRSPSERTEIMEAEEARNEVKNILSRTIGAEIQYVQDPASYSVRQPEFGYKNIKTDVDGKKRTIRAPDEAEAHWVREMFRLRAEGILSDEEIAQDLNNRGFVTRTFNRRDKETKKIVGKSGGKKLTAKTLKKYIHKTVYAGVVQETWGGTTLLTVKSNLWEGLVTIETFNKANKGKVYIEVRDDRTAHIMYNVKDKRRTRSKNNALFPYKNYVLCPICKRTLMGSASTGKLGGKYPYYHCERNHKRFSVKTSDMDKTIENFVASLKFKESFANDFRLVVRDLYQQEKKRLLENTVEASNLLVELKSQQDLLMDNLVVTKSALVRAELEKKYEELELDIALAIDSRNKSEAKELDLYYFENQLIKLMENPRKLLSQGAETVGIGNMFSRFFSEPPTYEDLVKGTPKLTPIFELSRNQEVSKDLMVTLRGIEPRLSG